MAISVSGISMVHRNQYAQCCASTAQWCASGTSIDNAQYGSILCIRHHYGTIWLCAVQALIYGPMMCIRHHNMIQTVYYASVRLDAWLEQCIMHQWLNTTWLSTLNLPNHTLSTCCLLLCLRLTLEVTNKVGKKKTGSHKNVITSNSKVLLTFLKPFQDHHRASCWL